MKRIFRLNTKNEDIRFWTSRLDLAIEADSLLRDDDNAEIEGVAEKVVRQNGALIHIISILDRRGAQRMGRPEGRYITIDIPTGSDDELTAAIAGVTAGQLAPLLPLPITGQPLLVAGLGNNSAIPDALGPRVVERTCATRHLFQQKSRLAEIAPVCTFAPGVLGNSGIESTEMLQSICLNIRPAAVIVADSLAAASVTRVGTTIQISDTGIKPGSGVDNRRGRIDSSLTGCPVIAIGVPTVVDSAAIIAETAGMLDDYWNGKHTAKPLTADAAACRYAEAKLLKRFQGKLMVTPKDIDELIARDAEIIAAAIAIAVHPAADKSNYRRFLC